MRTKLDKYVLLCYNRW